jgi:hypothetical protein
MQLTYFSIISRFISILWLAFAFTCTSGNESETRRILEEYVTDLDTRNDMALEKTIIEIAKMGNRPADINIMQDIQTLREKRKIVTINKYYTHLMAVQKTLPVFDSTSLAEAQKLQEQVSTFQRKTYTLKDSTVLLLSLLSLESDIIEFKASQIGIDCGFRIPSYTVKSTDTINLGHPFYMAIFFKQFSSAYQQKIKMDSSISVYRNTKQIRLPVRVEVIGNIMTLKLTPIQKGSYTLSGGYWFKRADGAYFNRKIIFKDNFFVR